MTKTKIILTNNNPQELELEQVIKTLVFKEEYFKDCETIEEIRDKFYNEYEGDFVSDYMQVYTYKTEEDFINDKFNEYLGE